MVGGVDLGGQRILVVEDDYLLASDTARALLRCGANVLGPCPTERAARNEMAGETPTGAVLDLNLGEGASFALAADLRARGVPFVIVTGYDEAIVPKEYAAAPLLQKPVQLCQIVSALATVLAGDA